MQNNKNEQEIKQQQEELQIKYDSFTKSDLLKGLKKYLKDNNRPRNKSDGFGRRKGNGLERPCINGKYYSWNSFSKLHKDVVLVYCLMAGCDLDYLLALQKRGWFDVNKKLRAKAYEDGKVIIGVSGGFLIKPKGWIGESNV